MIRTDKGGNVYLNNKYIGYMSQGLFYLSFLAYYEATSDSYMIKRIKFQWKYRKELRRVKQLAKMF